MPPHTETSMDFMRAILASEKTVFRRGNITPVHLPKFKELIMKALLQMLKADQELSAGSP